MSNADLENDLAVLPDAVADALEVFKTAGLEKTSLRAKTYLEIKARSAGTKTTVCEIEAQVYADQACYEAAMTEIKAESAYIRVNEKLMAAKKLATLRGAF